jgi:hypothetical protein
MIRIEIVIFVFMLVIGLLFIIWDISSTATAGDSGNYFPPGSCPNCDCTDYDNKLRTSNVYRKNCKECCGNKIAQSKIFLKNNATIDGQNWKGDKNEWLLERQQADKPVWYNRCPIGFETIGYRVAIKNADGKWDAKWGDEAVDDPKMAPIKKLWSTDCVNTGDEVIELKDGCPPPLEKCTAGGKVTCCYPCVPGRDPGCPATTATATAGDSGNYFPPGACKLDIDYVCDCTNRGNYGMRSGHDVKACKNCCLDKFAQSKIFLKKNAKIVDYDVLKNKNVWRLEQKSPDKPVWYPTTKVITPAGGWFSGHGGEVSVPNTCPIGFKAVGHRVAVKNAGKWDGDAGDAAADDPSLSGVDKLWSISCENALENEEEDQGSGCPPPMVKCTAGGKDTCCIPA